MPQASLPLAVISTVAPQRLTFVLDTTRTMPARRTSSAVALIVGASGLMLTCVFGFLSFVPGIDPSMGEFFQLAFFVGGVLALGGLVAYVLMSRKADAGEPLPKFDRMLEQRKAAMGAIPIGLVAVLIGALWYAVLALGASGVDVDVTPGENFADFQTPGIIAFLGFGTLYVALATFLVIRAERAAIRVARDETGVSR